VKSRARDRFPFAGYEVTGALVTKYIRVGNKTLAAKKGGEKLFYHNDHLGGVNVITDVNGLVALLIEYDPWGKISRSEGGGEGIIRFTGRKLDVESGLLYYGGRYYDPELGRFISPDPFVQEMFDPQSLNRYSYVINNPQNYIDPSGYFHRHKIKKSSGFFGSIFGAIFGFIFGGPAGAIFGAALAQLPPEVFHGLEIFGGIAMLLAGNPAGIAFMAQGALGFCKEQSCQYASAGFGLVGAALGGASSGVGGDSDGGGFSEAGGDGGRGSDFPVPQSPSLGGMGGQALISVAKTIYDLSRRTGGGDRCIDCSQVPPGGFLHGVAGQDIAAADSPNPLLVGPTGSGKVIPFPGPRPDRPYWLGPRPSPGQKGNVIPLRRTPSPPPPVVPPGPEPFPLMVPNVDLFRNYLNLLTGRAAPGI